MNDNTKPLIPGFDLDALRLPQNVGESLGVKRLITRAPVRKTNRFARVIRRIGRRVLIDEAAFFQWVDEQGETK